jgi:transposase
MDPQKQVPKRYIGLDVHKHYLVAYGVDGALTPLLGPRRVAYSELERWIGQTLTQEDALVLEMTTNTWELYDTLLPHVQSVTVVHPPHVALITRSQVMNDKIAARVLATLLAKDLLVGIWVPPEDVRQKRALIAQRAKMTRLATQAKNRLHAILHSRCIKPLIDNPFAPAQREWWLKLPLSPLELTVVRCDLDTLAFAEQQIAALEEALTQLGSQDKRLPLLVQLPGIGLINGLTILAAIGDITRFPSPKKLVGYAGLGSRVHDSGQTTRTGQITKAGRRDLRFTIVEAAQIAALTHPHWKAELARLEPRLGRNKAIVATPALAAGASVARKLLLCVWHVLTEQSADPFSEPDRIAHKLMVHAYCLGRAHRTPNLTAAAYVREQLDHLKIGQSVKAVPWSGKKKPIPLPPSTLAVTKT